MKKIIVFATGLLLLCACSKESAPSDDFVPLDTIVCTRTVTLDDGTKSMAKAVSLTLTTVYNVNDAQVSAFSISSSESEIDVDTLKELALKQFKEENGFAYEGTNLNEIIASAMGNNSSINPTRDCFVSCQELKKGEGRGWCRLGCLVDAMQRALQTVADTLVEICKPDNHDNQNK